MDNKMEAMREAMMEKSRKKKMMDDSENKKLKAKLVKGRDKDVKKY